MLRRLALAVLLTLLGVALPVLAQTAVGTEEPDPYAAGMAAFQARDYATACPLLERAAESRPNDTQLLLNLAISQFSTGQFDKAEKSYRTLHALRPDDQRIQFELGRTLTECCKYEEARALLLQVRNSSPPPELQSGLATMLDRLDDLEKRTRFGGSAEVTVLNDDNINVGPNDGTLGNINLDPNTLPKTSTGMGYAAMLGVEHKLDAKGDWRLSGGLSRNEIRYSRHTQYNVGVTNVSLRLNRKLEKGTVQTALNYTDIDQGEMNSINTFSPSALWMHAIDQRLQLITDASVEFRDNCKDHTADSHYYTAGGYLRWFFGEGNKHYLLGGLRGFTENARAPHNSNDGAEFKIAPSFSLPWLVRLDLSATLGRTLYNAPPAGTTNDDRRDQKHTFSGSLSRELWDQNSKAVFSFIHTRNQSNYGPNSYFKNTTKFSLSYSF